MNGCGRRRSHPCTRRPTPRTHATSRCTDGTNGSRRDGLRGREARLGGSGPMPNGPRRCPSRDDSPCRPRHPDCRSPRQSEGGRSPGAPCVSQRAGSVPATYAGVVARERTLVCERLATRIPGVQVAVAVNGKLAWSEGFGYADAERQKPVTRETQFRIGSVSKPLTATAVALLYEQGKLDLDAPVQRYVPSFPDKGYPVTTRL